MFVIRRRIYLMTVPCKDILHPFITTSKRSPNVCHRPKRSLSNVCFRPKADIQRRASAGSQQRRKATLLNAALNALVGGQPPILIWR